ncbi:MAG TPA: transposase [Aeromonadales bacterium]|nr:transposase [Aeromonadales bacterium]
MTDKPRQAKSYTPEFRESAVQLAIESVKSVSVVARELDVNALCIG